MPLLQRNAVDTGEPDAAHREAAPCRAGGAVTTLHIHSMVFHRKTRNGYIYRCEICGAIDTEWA